MRVTIEEANQKIILDIRDEPNGVSINRTNDYDGWISAFPGTPLVPTEVSKRVEVNIVGDLMTMMIERKYQ